MWGLVALIVVIAAIVSAKVRTRVFASSTHGGIVTTQTLITDSKDDAKSSNTRTRKWTDADYRKAFNPNTVTHSADSSIGFKIASGHAYDKHVVGEKQFQGIVHSRAEFASHLDHIIQSPTAKRDLSNDRTAYWDQKSGTVIIHNPHASDGGTAFQPRNGSAYYDHLQ